MCCCGKPVINGEQGYSWDGKTFSVRRPIFPALEEGDTIVRELPGRCGGIDSHSYDFRLVRREITGVDLLVHHGGGQERIKLGGHRPAGKTIEAMSDSDCYWLMQMLFHVHSEAASRARKTERLKWHKAAVEKRIKVRKVRNRDYATVEIITGK